MCGQEFSEIHVGLQAPPGLLGLSIPLSFCPSRTCNGPGFSSKCPSVFLLPIHYGTTQRTPRPPNQWAALRQWHQWTGLRRWGAWEQGLPSSGHGLCRHETSAALPRGASAGNVVLGLWACRHRPARAEWLGCSPAVLPSSLHPGLLGQAFLRNSSSAEQ